MSNYFRNINLGLKTTLKGLSITIKHFFAARKTKLPINVENEQYFQLNNGLVTLQYPHQSISIPENGRYQLDCEIDDCIVCDKCAKICPVDCIEIESIKSSELISYASDGSPIRLYAAKFDIDMAKCCFCGLCTTVCPTECLSMSNEFDFSVADVSALNYAFAKLTPEVADEKRKLYEQYMLEKQQNATQKKVEKTEQIASKPSFKPAFKPSAKPIPSTEQETKTEEEAPKPTFRPIVKPQALSSETKETEIVEKPKPVFKPSMMVSPVVSEQKNEGEPSPQKPKPVFKPSMKANPAVSEQKNEKDSSSPTPKPVFKPSMKAVASENIEEKVLEAAPKPKPVFRPTMKSPSSATTDEVVSKEFEQKQDIQPKPKPIFKPTMKPKSESTDNKIDKQ